MTSGTIDDGGQNRADFGDSRATGHEEFKGMLDDFVGMPRALTSNEVYDLYISTTNNHPREIR